MDEKLAGKAAHPRRRRQIRCILRLVRGAEGGRQGRARLDLERHLPCRRAGGGRVRSRLARLLREHLQPGPGEPRSHAGAHAEEVLAEPARDRGDSGLVRSAASRFSSMLEQEPTMPTKRTPEKALEAMRDREIKSLAQLNKLLKGSEPLVKGATQAVPGEGPEDAEIVFVGEQPGDQEDLQGRPSRSSTARSATPGSTATGSMSRMPSSTSSSSSGASAAFMASPPPARSSIIAGGSRRNSSSSGRSSWWRSAAPPSSP